MKRNLYIIMVCCAAALVSCKKNEVDNPNHGTDPEPQPEGKTVLYGSLSEATKTYLSPNDDESQFDVYWEFQDSITIKKEGGSYATFWWTEEVTGSKKTVPFTQKSGDPLKLENGDVIEAFYPAEIYGESLIWPSEQRYVVYSNTPAGAVGNNPMWAETSIKSGTTEMLFYNLGGVIRFKLSKPTAEFKVVKAMISADQPMSGEFRLDVADKPEAKKAVITKAGPGITITPERAVTISTTDSASFYFAVPENTYTGVQITLVGENGTKVNARLAAGKALEVKRAEVVRLTANGVTPSMEGSNCFIGEGNVPIVITAMGQVPGTYTTDNGYCTTWQSLIAGGVQGCKIVWETVNTATKPADNTIIKSAEFANGVLTLVPTGTPGNALVAVTKKDGKGQDEIVWSYHIWVPETPIATKSLNGVILLDRNLGALTETGVTSLGMQYQWGRKDPLLGFCTFDNIGKYVMNGVLNNSTYLPTTYYTTNKGLTSSIQNPDKWIRVSQSNWCSGNVSKFWGCGIASSVTNTEDIYSKTIYDPCPSGYRVASKKDFRTAFGSQKASLADNLFTISGVYFPSVAKMHHGSSNSYYETGKGLGVTTATVYSEQIHQWNLSLANNEVIKFGSTSDGDYGAESYNVRCVRDTQSPASEGYTLNEMDHEYINFFE